MYGNRNERKKRYIPSRVAGLLRESNAGKFRTWTKLDERSTPCTLGVLLPDRESEGGELCVTSLPHTIGCHEFVTTSLNGPSLVVAIDCDTNCRFPLVVGLPTRHLKRLDVPRYSFLASFVRASCPGTNSHSGLFSHFFPGLVSSRLVGCCFLANHHHEHARHQEWFFFVSSSSSS